MSVDAVLEDVRQGSLQQMTHTVAFSVDSIFPVVFFYVIAYFIVQADVIGKLPSLLQSLLTSLP